jgi:hypothetical protein
MTIGRTDEQETPLVAKAVACRIRVWGLFGETRLGQRSCMHRVEGRTHDRTRSERQIEQRNPSLGGPSTRATTPPAHKDFDTRTLPVTAYTPNRPLQEFRDNIR